MTERHWAIQAWLDGELEAVEVILLGMILNDMELKAWSYFYVGVQVNDPKYLLKIGNPA